MIKNNENITNYSYSTSDIYDLGNFGNVKRRSRDYISQIQYNSTITYELKGRGP